MSGALNTRPSSLVGVTDVMAAYCLDQVVWYAGSTIDSDLQKAVDNATSSKGSNKNKGKAEMAQKRVFRKYFGADAEPKQFADPSAFA